MGLGISRQPGRGHFAEGPDCRCDPAGRHGCLPCRYEAAVVRFCMATPFRISRSVDPARNCGSLAHPGDPPDATLLRFLASQRPRAIPWVFLGLFRKRACVAFPESALPSRLQHRPARGLLATPPALAISMERLFSGCHPSWLSLVRPGWTHETPRPVLGRVPAGVLYVLYNPGILFHAALPSTCLTARLRPGRRERLVEDRNALSWHPMRRVRHGHPCDPACRVERSHSRRHRLRFAAASGGIYLIPRSPGRSDDPVLRLLADATHLGGHCVSLRGGERMAGSAKTRNPRIRPDDDPVPSREQAGPGDVRAVSFLAAAGGSPEPLSQGKADRGRRLLFILVGFLLLQYDCSAFEWPDQQS